MCGCSQQYELYAAEREGTRGRQFATVKEMQAFVDALRDTWWWQRYYPKVLHVEVGRAPRNGRGSVGGWFAENNTGRMEMHPDHWCEQYVLHELAHVLAAYRYGSKAHCPWFARVYLELVYEVQGADAFVALHAAFDRHSIQHDIPDDEHDILRARPMPEATA